MFDHMKPTCKICNHLKNEESIDIEFFFLFRSDEDFSDFDDDTEGDDYSYYYEDSAQQLLVMKP